MPSTYRYFLYLSYLSCFLTGIPIALGLIRIKHFSVSTKLILLLMIISIVTEISIFALHKLHISNLFVARLFDAVEFILLSFFFERIFSETKKKFSHALSSVVKVFMIIFIGVAFFDLYTNGFNSMDNISLTTACILLMIYSIIAFFHLIQNPVFDNILRAPLFWFNTGILAYFSGNLFLFIFSNYIEDHFPRLSPALWGIHSLLNITFYILISIGFWKTAARQI